MSEEGTVQDDGKADLAPLAEEFLHELEVGILRLVSTVDLEKLVVHGQENHPHEEGAHRITHLYQPGLEVDLRVEIDNPDDWEVRIRHV